MASIQEKNRDETGESSRLGFHPIQGISFQSQSSASNENIEELQIPQRPCPKSQRKIVPTEKARKICNAPPETEEGAEKIPVSLLTCIWRLGTIHILRNHF